MTRAEIEHVYDVLLERYVQPHLDRLPEWANEVDRLNTLRYWDLLPDAEGAD